MFAFRAKDEAQVHAFHVAAIGNGGVMRELQVRDRTTSRPSTLHTFGTRMETS